MNYNNNKLNFDASQIPQNRYNTEYAQQQKFVNDYNNYQPFNNMKTDYSTFNIQKNFNNVTPITNYPTNKYENNTLYNNINENICKETINEIRLNIDSMDRDIRLYPDPFKYVVSFGPIVNSGVDSTIKRSELKNELRNLNKKKNISTPSSQDFSDDLLIFSDNPNMIVTYDDKLKRIFNPYISRDFKNVKFIRLDNVVLPRFNKVIINHDWSPNNDDSKTKFIKDDYDRTKFEIKSNNRYIPDDNHIGPLFTDRYVLINIKEIENNYNLATNHINTSSFTIFPDKYIGLLYWRGNPYYAVKIYQDSALGNINKLSFEFYDSWGKPITLNRTCVDYEVNQLLNTDIINPTYITNVNDTKMMTFYIKKITEIIKCFVAINFNIKEKINFYEDEIIFNKKDFNFLDVAHELNEFITVNGFVNINKANKNGKKNHMSIDDYINNIYWFNNDYKNKQVLHNLNVLLDNYKNYGFKILDKLKNEAINIPLNKYFQNHLMFVLGMYGNEINTKINFYQ